MKHNTSVVNNRKWWDTASEYLGIFGTAFVICNFGLCFSGAWSIFIASYYQDDYALGNNVLRGLLYQLFWSTAPNLLFFTIFCGFLKWNFYYRQRDHPEDWKSQPRKFLTWVQEKEEIVLSISSLTMASLLTGVVSWYIANGGFNTIYFSVADYGWIYYFFSIPAIFYASEFLFYWSHRFYHLPYFYIMFHKDHHSYKQPTPFAATALHPVEMVLSQSIMLASIFTVPIHWSVLFMHVSYCYYYGIWNHSGIKLQALWPWQPSTTFHDNHHQYFHCNYGLNVDTYDKLFGTLRRKDRVYNEKVFNGKGKPFDQATPEEVAEHLDNVQDDREL